MTADSSPPSTPNAATLHRVAGIVAAYVSHNAIRTSDLPALISSVHRSLLDLASPSPVPDLATASDPAVPIKKSVGRDYIVCLECGKRFKSLRRHLNSFHGLTPEAYRTKWGLPGDYPMVAPAYSETRSQLAKDSGLGQVARSADDKASKGGRAHKS